MRTLLFCPTYRLEPETVNAIFRLKQVGGMDVFFTRDNPTSDRKENILYNYQRGRKVFLEGGYDFLLVIESDMIPPADALERLSRVHADIALGLYMFRHGNPMLNALRLEGWKNPGQSLSLFPGEVKAAWKKGIIRTGGAGLGCALIQRRVLEKISFRNAKGGDCDWHFTSDCLREGYVHKVDFNVQCGHKRPDGVILWPTVQGYDITQGIPSSWNMASPYEDEVQ